MNMVNNTCTAHIHIICTRSINIQNGISRHPKMYLNPSCNSLDITYDLKSVYMNFNGRSFDTSLDMKWSPFEHTLTAQLGISNGYP